MLSSSQVGNFSEPKTDCESRPLRAWSSQNWPAVHWILSWARWGEAWFVDGKFYELMLPCGASKASKR